MYVVYLCERARHKETAVQPDMFVCTFMCLRVRIGVYACVAVFARTRERARAQAREREQARAWTRARATEQGERGVQ